MNIKQKEKLKVSRAFAYMVLYLGLYLFIIYGVKQEAGLWAAIMGGFLIIVFEVQSMLIMKQHTAIMAMRDFIDNQVNLNNEQHKLNLSQHKINILHKDQIGTILNVAKKAEIETSEKKSPNKTGFNKTDPGSFDNVIPFSIDQV